MQGCTHACVEIVVSFTGDTLRRRCLCLPHTSGNCLPVLPLQYDVSAHATLCQFKGALGRTNIVLDCSAVGCNREMHLNLSWSITFEKCIHQQSVQLCTDCYLRVGALILNVGLVVADTFCVWL